MIKKLSHIGILVNNLEEATKLWVETYGLKVSHSGSGDVEGIRSLFLSCGDNYIELLEPIDHQDMNNAIAKRLATRGEGIYHIAVVADDIEQEVKKLTDKGVILIERPPTDTQPKGRWVTHPKSATGVLVEFLS